MNGFLGKVGGKKMFALIGYVCLTMFKDKIGLGEEEFGNISKTLMAYFIGQGVADGLSKGATSHAE